jgi:hypothetical protein
MVRNAIRTFSLLARALPMCAAALISASQAAGGAGEILPLYDGPGGVTCQYFNAAVRVPWRNRLGDWKDANGQEQGTAPFAQATVRDLDEVQVVEWDVTQLVGGWLNGAYQNGGLLIAAARDRQPGAAHFFSREADDPSSRPALLLEFADETRQSIVPSADANLSCSTAKALGKDKLIKAWKDGTILIRFELGPSKGTSPLRKATLRLTTTDRQYGETTLGIYRLTPPVRPAPGRRELGLAKDYPRDRDLERQPDVIMAAGFETAKWITDWSYVNPSQTFEVVSSDDRLKFTPLNGRALRVTIPRGGNLGLDMGFNFKDKLGEEPEEVYFRYYLRFADDWAPTVEGGKLPGIGGTYGRAGWGGRKSDGTAGWSMRGLFGRMSEEGNPLREYTWIGTYAYHAEMKGFSGDNWVWTEGLRGLLRKNQWYSIEQYFKVNMPGKHDGAIKVWVDGELAYQRSGIRVRDIDSIKIEKIWMNVYHGGRAPAPADMHLYIDNVVVARRYIGPMRSE